MMTADTIADEATDPAVIRRAQGVKQESQRMFDLVKNLLDSSAAESGQLTLRREPVDLAALVREAVPALGDRTARKNQPIEITADPHCAVAGDARRLRQVLDNLVDNASKFSPPDTTIRLVVARSAKHVRLEVHDQGPGLTEEDRRSLFQRFRRLSATPTAGESSNGLGLALAHDLVTQHGGRIWAEPRSSGGSVFITELPAK
jgi:signal transduction histidine kinase